MRERAALEFPSLIARFQIPHVAGVAGGDPVREEFVFGGVSSTRDTGEVETCFVCEMLDFLFELECLLHALDGFDDYTVGGAPGFPAFLSRGLGALRVKCHKGRKGGGRWIRGALRLPAIALVQSA